MAGTEGAGRGNGRDFCSFEKPNTSIEGCSGLQDTEIIGVVGLSGKLISGAGASTLFTTASAAPSSGRLMMGTAGAQSATAGTTELGRLPCPSTGLSGQRVSSAGCQVLSKLTMGRPGTLLTAVGVGSFGLRSFNRIVVAALMSSLRISMPSFDVGVSTLWVTSIAGDGAAEFAVYAALRD